MKELKFNFNIKADKKTIWFSLWDTAHYKIWTKIFGSGSTLKGELKQGHHIHFVNPNGGGMYCLIEKYVENEIIAFKTIAALKGFKEQEADEESKKWEGSGETYQLTENADSTTTLTVTLQVSENYINYINDIYPQAITELIKQAETFRIIVQTNVHASIKKVWDTWISPQHIMQWNTASPEWQTPKAENDLCVGGKFSFYMTAKDGSMSFDFWGTYSEIKTHQLIAYTMGDNRKAEIYFSETNGIVSIIECFEPESINSFELQKMGWQSILTNFKKYAEA